MTSLDPANSYLAECAQIQAPEIETEDVPLCNLCGSAQFHSFAIGYDYELLTCRNLWHIVQCRQCGHVWLHPRPAVKELGVIYPSSYYAYNYTTQINRIAQAGKAALDQLKMRGIAKHAGRTPASYVDIGCGNGRFLKLMEGYGIPRANLHGLDLDEACLSRLCEQGYQAHCCRVEDCTAIANASIDLATMFHVIEHVADPAAVVTKIVDWLRPGGVLAIETPNIQSLDARLFGKTFWGGYHIPRHWHLFSAETLQRLMQDNGLTIVSAKYQTGHSFWMYSFHHWIRYGWGRPRLARWCDPFRSLIPLVAATGFDKLRAAIGFRTSSVLVVGRKPA